jgi:hypothetical protein
MNLFTRLFARKNPHFVVEPANPVLETKLPSADQFRWDDDRYLTVEDARYLSAEDRPKS